jgi:hypothetical protein
MGADWIELYEAKIQYRGLVNSTIYIQELCNKDSTAYDWLL